MSSPSSEPQDFWLAWPLPGLLVWVGLGVGLCFLMSCAGWRRFARKYPARVRPAGKAYHVSGAQFGLATYRSLVRVVFTEEGIYVYAGLLCRPFHAPFLLPWESVQRVEKEQGFLFGHYYLVYVKDAVGRFHLWLPGKVEGDLFRYLRRPAAAMG